MAVAYKGFRFLEVVGFDKTNIVNDYGDVEITIATRIGSLYSGDSSTQELAINRINSNTPDRLDILGFCGYTMDQYSLSFLQSVLPGIKHTSINQPASGNNLILLASNGTFIDNNGNIFDANGAQIGSIGGFGTSYSVNCKCCYLSINNFDGTVPSSGTIYCDSVYMPNFNRMNTSERGSTLTQAVADWFNAIGPLPTDPYAQGGTSDTGGGTGNFDLTSDQIDVPNVPTLSAVDTGLVTLYTPTLAQLQALAQYLWNANATTIDWWKKLIANPLDLILGLSIVPVAVPQGATENVRVGLIDTGVAMTKAASQYVQVDCGSLNITEFYGAALDYLPFRKTSIYLPFIGTRSISTDDIMGKTVQVVYNIDLLSGALTAMVKCGDAVLYQYSGACNIAIPLSGQSFTDLALSTLQLAAGIGATVATGGAAAGVVAANAANSVMSMKPTIERAGGVSGAAGQLAVMRPYLIGEIPRQSVPKDYNQFAGYPSNISAVLGDLEGYTEVETIYLEGITATSDELNEIENLLKSGVYI